MLRNIDKLFDFVQQHHGHGVGMHSVSVYVPSTVGSKYLTKDAHSAVANVVSELLSLFHGGATVHDGHGSWLDDHGNLVTEPVKIVQSFYRPEDHERAAHFILRHFNIATALAHAMNQSAVLLHHSYDGKNKVSFVGKDNRIMAEPDKMTFDFVGNVIRAIGHAPSGEQLHKDDERSVIRHATSVINEMYRNYRDAYENKVGDTDMIRLARGYDYAKSFK